MIYTLTLNPAIDQVLYLPKFKKNVTNRLKGSMATVGGKGTHVSIDLALMHMPNRAFGICFGEKGMHIKNMLSAYDGLDERFLHYDSGESRTNYLVIEDNGDCSILAEKGIELDDEKIAEIIDLLKKEMSDNDTIIFSGDVSNYKDPFVYNKILEELKDKKLNIYIDTSGKTLKSCLDAHPFMIKPNLDELSTICGYEIPEDNDEEIIKALRSIDNYNIPVIALSLGGDGSIIKKGNDIYRIRAPKVNVINTIGCGDCFLSGLVFCIENKMDIEDAARYATAVSAAAAESNDSVGFDAKRAEELMKLVEITKL